jgi:hypothetical protein
LTTIACAQIREHHTFWSVRGRRRADVQLADAALALDVPQGDLTGSFEFCDARFLFTPPKTRP